MTVDIELKDLEHLAWVAEGRWAQVPDAALDRLIRAGLIREPDRIIDRGPPVELTPAGLARVRSSDQ